MTMPVSDEDSPNPSSPSSSRSGKVVVVGGGIIGVSIAWYLQRQGWSVTIIDRGRIGGACSHANCGLVCPSHVLPLTEPGAFKVALKSLFTPNSPFRIRPRLDPALWSWLWHFARRCHHSAMLEAGHAIQALLNASMREYQDWVTEAGIDCEWQQRGLLYVYKQTRELERYAVINELLSERFDEPARRLSAEETIDMEPALRHDIAGSWYYQHDAHLRPDKLLAAARQRLESLGCRFVEHCELTRVQGANHIATHVKTTSESLQADQFVIATGAWTPRLSEQLGCKLPIQPGKGYSITMPRPQACPNLPIILPERRVVVTPMVSGYRLGSIMEFAGYDTSIRSNRLQLLRDGARPYLRDPYGEPELETWYGWRPMTYDSLPIIGQSPRWENMWVATGHNMLGLSMAPATGKLVAELLSGTTPHIDPTPYRLKRFQKR